MIMRSDNNIHEILNIILYTVVCVNNFIYLSYFIFEFSNLVSVFLWILMFILFSIIDSMLYLNHLLVCQYSWLVVLSHLVWEADSEGDAVAEDY